MFTSLAPPVSPSTSAGVAGVSFSGGDDAGDILSTVGGVLGAFFISF